MLTSSRTVRAFSNWVRLAILPLHSTLLLLDIHHSHRFCRGVYTYLGRIILSTTCDSFISIDWADKVLMSHFYSPILEWQCQSRVTGLAWKKFRNVVKVHYLTDSRMQSPSWQVSGLSWGNNSGSSRAELKLQCPMDRITFSGRFRTMTHFWKTSPSSFE